MKFIQTVFIILLTVGTAFSAEYHVNQEQDNVVKFISDAPLEDFEGVTDMIDGYVFWEGDNMLNNSELYFEVDLNSIDTGIGLRNKHMRERFLETEEYPFAKFSGKLTKSEEVEDGKYNVTVEGTMSIHGVEREITVDGTATSTGEGFHVETSFVTALPDYNIKIPQLMFMKIDEDMQLELDFYVKEVD